MRRHHQLGRRRTCLDQPGPGDRVTGPTDAGAAAPRTSSRCAFGTNTGRVAIVFVVLVLVLGSEGEGDSRGGLSGRGFGVVRHWRSSYWDVLEVLFFVLAAWSASLWGDPSTAAADLVSSTPDRAPPATNVRARSPGVERSSSASRRHRHQAVRLGDREGPRPTGPGSGEAGKRGSGEAGKHLKPPLLERASTDAGGRQLGQRSMR